MSATAHDRGAPETDLGVTGETIPALLRARARATPETPAYLYERADGWHTLDWGKVDRRVDRLAAAMLERGLERGDKVAVLGATRLEWALCDLAILRCGGVSVGIYPTLTRDQVRFILEHSDSRLLFVDTAEQLDKVAPLLGELPRLEGLVLWDDHADVPSVTALGDFEAAGGDALAARPDCTAQTERAVRPGDPANLVFTSGTTGNPKAATLTHHNVVTQARILDFTEFGDVTLAVLPMAHVGERCAGHYQRVHSGATAAFVPDLNDVGRALTEIEPHYFGCVPRIFEKFHEAITARLRAAPAWRQRLADRALAIGRRYRDEPRPGPLLRAAHGLADRLVLRHIRAPFGGRIRECVTGGAPFDRAILDFFHAAGLTIRECYGQSETAGFILVNPRGEVRLGTVGRPLPGCEARTGSDGELEFRGEVVFAGYYKDPERTRETFTEDGWLKSGDLGEIDADGYVRLVGRKKEIIITAGGKNVAPGNIEHLLQGHPLVEQALVHGDRRRYLTALIALSPEAAREWAEAQGLRGDDLESLTREPALREEIQRHVDEVNAQLARFETVKSFAFLPRPLDLEHGELTPTMKVKRAVVEERFAHLLDPLYGD